MGGGGDEKHETISDCKYKDNEKERQTLDNKQKPMNTKEKKLTKITKSEEEREDTPHHQRKLGKE